VLNWMAAIRHPAGVLNPQVVRAEGSASEYSGALQD
jgi:hypothetical protein